jgi:hypothetical protein
MANRVAKRRTRSAPLRLLGPVAAEFFLTRYWNRTAVGPYVVVTCEVQPSAYETTVTWGDGGSQVDCFGSAFAFDEGNARKAHDDLCEQVELNTGLARVPITNGSPAA